MANRYHYKNMPIQIYWKFYHQKQKIFRQKIWYSPYFCSKHRLWVPIRTASARQFYEYPQSIFWTEIRKIMYTLVNPSFTIKKWGLRGSKLYRHVFVMWTINSIYPKFSERQAWTNSVDPDQMPYKADVVTVYTVSHLSRAQLFKALLA